MSRTLYQLEGQQLRAVLQRIESAEMRINSPYSQRELDDALELLGQAATLLNDYLLNAPTVHEEC